MFGYIAINKAEMKFKDYDLYHSYYCGLCRRLKDIYGIRGQMTLSYDMTFLILLLTGLYEPATNTSVFTCMAHPFTKHTARTNTYTDYAASMNLVLSYYKCKDDWKDEHRKKSLLASSALRPKVNIAVSRYPKKAARISSDLQKLSYYEKLQETDLDRMAGFFGGIMAEIFALREDEWEKSLRKIGFFLGKFIYLMDAYEDIEKDTKSGSYNPLKKTFRADAGFAEDFRTVLTLMMSECSREFEKLPILLHADILRNILYSGVWRRYAIITQKRLHPERTQPAPTGEQIL